MSTTTIEIIYDDGSADVYRGDFVLDPFNGALVGGTANRVDVFDGADLEFTLESFNVAALTIEGFYRLVRE